LITDTVYVPEGLAEIHKVSGKCQLLRGRFTGEGPKILSQTAESSGIVKIPDKA
jgi:hypothetical protein